MKNFDYMHSYEKEIWLDLMKLVETNEAFFYVDQFHLNRWWRIFNYRLASYTDFLEPSALECRGIMFEIDSEGRDADPLRIAARPMQKFFNYRENPMTMDVDLYDVEHVFDKADGSLITSYLVDGVVHLKSKGSLHSEQAMAATRLLRTPEYKWMEEEIFHFHVAEACVNMEYVAPDNRIVLGYMEPKLIVLNARDTITGDYWSHDEMVVTFGDHACHEYDFDHGDVVGGKSRNEVIAEFLEQLPQSTNNIEGVVVMMPGGRHGGLWMKIKTEQYLTAHRAKDSINSDRRLFEAVLEEATDDLRSLFYDDELALARIAEMEQKVETIYNHTVDTVERFYERNKELERKTYAILGQEELEKPHFGLAMSKYLGKEVDYKAFMRKNYKAFGIKDDPESTGDEE